MRGAERGFLLLACHLGDPDRKVLTASQLRTLAKRVRGREESHREGELAPSDLKVLGYSTDMAEHIISLLSQEALLDRYLRLGKKANCVPVTWATPGYPAALRRRLGLDSPGCLWAKGDLRLLERPKIALAGSRDLNPENRRFAAEVGRQAARQGYVLVSGNARGADRTAQESCLEHGGAVISIVADRLDEKKQWENVLYLSEEGFDLPFSAQRALSRNRCIHALGRMVFVAQSRAQQGGTWDGTVKNLRFGWSPVACFRDDSEASRQLEEMGAYLIGKEDLKDFGTLPESDGNFLT